MGKAVFRLARCTTVALVLWSFGPAAVPAFAQGQGVGVTVEGTASPGATSSPGTTTSPGATLAPGATPASGAILAPGATLAPGGAGGSNVLGSSTAPGGTRDLPKTGTDLALLVAMAIALIALGAVFAGVAERRRRLST